jgi:hypothetical protein
MEATLLKILESSPIAGAMIALVYMFLNALDKRDSRLTDIHQDFKGVVERNTNALIEFSGTIDECRRKNAKP